MAAYAEYDSLFGRSPLILMEYPNIVGDTEVRKRIFPFFFADLLIIFCFVGAELMIFQYQFISAIDEQFYRLNWNKLIFTIFKENIM